MRDKVVALENKAYAMVTVNVPVYVLEVTGAFSVYDEISGGVLVKAADDVEKGSLSTARRAKHGDELPVSEGKADTL